MKEVYLITYTLFLKSETIKKQTRVKNCNSEIHAKIKLNDYLKSKHNDFIRLEVNKCEFDVFNSIFGKHF